MICPSFNYFCIIDKVITYNDWKTCTQIIEHDIKP